MPTIDNAGTVQAGVTAPALVDPQAQPREAPERRPADTELGGSDAATVDISSQAQSAAVPSSPSVQQDSSGSDSAAPDRSDIARQRAENTTSRIREQASSVQVNRRTAFDAENGQIEVRAGDEVVREIPSEEVVRIRESIESFRQAQENIDITA